MQTPKRWTLLLAGCVLAAVVVGRILLMEEARPGLVAESDTRVVHCAPLFTEGAPPSVTEPGGIDPLGVTRAIRLALDDCP